MQKFPARLGSELRLGDGATPLADTLALGTEVGAGRPASALLRERLAAVATCSSPAVRASVGLECHVAMLRHCDVCSRCP